MVTYCSINATFRNLCSADCAQYAYTYISVETLGLQWLSKQTLGLISGCKLLILPPCPVSFHRFNSFLYSSDNKITSQKVTLV